MPGKPSFSHLDLKSTFGIGIALFKKILGCQLVIKTESRQFIDKTTHRHGFWRQFIDTIEDNSSTLFEDNSSTHSFEYNLQS